MFLLFDADISVIASTQNHFRDYNKVSVDKCACEIHNECLRRNDSWDIWVIHE